MTRIIGILVLAVLCSPAARPQNPAPEDPLRALETRQRDWSQSNTVLLEAVRRLNPCSPRLVSLLTQVRADSASLAEANAFYFTRFIAAARDDIAARRKLVEDVEAAAESAKPPAHILQNDAEWVAAKQQLAGRDDSINTAVRTAVKNLAPATAATLPAGEIEAAARRLRGDLDAKESLLRQLEAGGAAELTRWTAYYDGIEAGIKKACAESRPVTKTRQSAPPR